MTSPAECEAALRQLEQAPPVMITSGKRGRHTSLWRESDFLQQLVRFPTAIVDVIQRGEALAIFERDLMIHFQQISKAAALYVRALGVIKRALEVYCRVDDTTNTYPWPLPTTEEIWHSHAEGVLMVALTHLNLPPKQWRSARLLTVDLS